MQTISNSNLITPKFRYVGYLLIALIALLQAECSANSQESSNTATIEPRLVYQSAVSTTFSWCGNGALVLTWTNEKNPNSIDWLDIATAKLKTVSKEQAKIFHNCSPDGKWLVYQDRKTNRADKKWHPTCSDCTEWDGYVTDLWRYEVATDVRQKFAVIRSGSPVLSMAPVGYQVLIGGRHSVSMPMPEPKWEQLWFGDSPQFDNQFSEFAWFPDGTGIAMPVHGLMGSKELLIQFFGKDGWIKSFKTDFEEIYQLKIAQGNMLYFVGKARVHQGQKRRGMELYRCNLQGQTNFACSQVKEIGESIYASSYDVSRNGDVFYYSKAQGCIARLKVGENQTSCITSQLGLPEGGVSLGVSPNGEKLGYSFTRHEKVNPSCTQNCAGWPKNTDIYLLDLKRGTQ